MPLITTSSFQDFPNPDAYTLNNYSLVQEKVFAENTNVRGIFFKPDGTKLFMTGLAGIGIFEYDLSTAWDISSLTFVQSFSTTPYNSPRGIAIKSDGTKVILNVAGTPVITEYDLAGSPEWDISTATQGSPSIFDPSPVSSIQGLFVRTDGIKMYTTDVSSEGIDEFDLSIPWDVTSASHVQTNTSLGFLNPNGIDFKPDGTVAFIVSSHSDRLYEFSLSTPWDISTLSSVQNVMAQVSGPVDVVIKPGGETVFLLDNFASKISEFSLT